MTIKILVLDSDGVVCLNGTSFEPYALDNLRRIIEETGAKIVISSTWRLYPLWLQDLKKAVQSIGGEVIGLTPNLSALEMTLERLKYGFDADEPCVPRWVEIQSWLDTEGKQFDITRFVILDDWAEAGIPGQPESFVHTNDRKGLTYNCAQKAIDWLNG